MQISTVLRLNVHPPLQDWPLYPESEISWGARDSRGHLWFEDKAAGLTVGLWESEANLGRWMNWPVHEFMIILEGEVVMIEDNCETVVRKGECFVIPKGCRCIWNQPTYLKKVMMLCDGATQATAQIVKFDLNESANKCGDPLLTYQDPRHRFEVGFDEHLSGAPTLRRKARYELSYLLGRSVTLADDKSPAQTFGTGEAVFISQDADVSWKSDGPVQRLYCGWELTATPTNH